MKEHFNIQRCFASQRLLLLLWSLLLWPGILGAQSGKAMTADSSYADYLRCGPNSLLVFMVLCGHSELTAADIDQIPVSPVGVSLLTLRDAARKFGIDAEIRLYRTNDLDELPLPAIGQFVSTTTSITSNHFDVIYKVSESRVYMIDGTTGKSWSAPKRNLSFQWTGFAMTQKQTLRTVLANEWPKVVFAIGLIMADVIVVRFFMWKLKHYSGRGVKGTSEPGKYRMSVQNVFILALSFLCICPIKSKASPMGSWRCADNDGINVLYCYLHIHQARCTYLDLQSTRVKGSRGDHLAASSLTDIAAKTFLPLQAVSLTSGELRSCGLPIIVHIDGESPDAGEFILLLSMTDESLQYVSGASATIRSMRREDFQRVWSGIALLPKGYRNWTAAKTVVGFAVGFIAPLVLFRRNNIIARRNHDQHKHT